MSEKKGKKRPKSYYLKCAKKKLNHHGRLQPEHHGFLVTFNRNEKECIRQTYQLLNHYGDMVYGPEKVASQATDPSESLDIEDQLKLEIDNFKTAGKTERRFQVLTSGANNCIFVKTTVSDPASFVHTILSDLKSTPQQRFRNIFRLLPVSVVCKAYIEDIVKASQTLLPKYFEETGTSGKTYAILFKVRNNGMLKRDTVIATLASLIQQLNPANKADLGCPDLAVIVEVICNCCCLAVVSDYFLLKKYNVAELIKLPLPPTETSNDGGNDCIPGTATVNVEHAKNHKSEIDVTDQKSEIDDTEVNVSSSEVETVGQESETRIDDSTAKISDSRQC